MSGLVPFTFLPDEEISRIAAAVADGKLDAETVASFKAGGHPYYLYSGHGDVRSDNCFLIGDAAGLICFPFVSTGVPGFDQDFEYAYYVKTMLGRIRQHYQRFAVRGTL